MLVGESPMSEGIALHLLRLRQRAGASHVQAATTSASRLIRSLLTLCCRSTTDAPTLTDFLHEHKNPATLVFTDEARAYDGLKSPHSRVKHSVKEFVNGMIHTNGFESNWASMKRAKAGVYHHFSMKHIDRYHNEFAGRDNARQLDTEAQMTDKAQRGIGKWLRFGNLSGPRNSRQPLMVRHW